MKLKINNEIIKINNFSTDSRKIQKGDLFIAYKGVNSDAHDYIEKAIEAGAQYIVGEKSYNELKKIFSKYPSVKYFQVTDGRECWADLCAQQYGYPQKNLKIIGITGTDGKTTTTTIIYDLLRLSGKKVGLISTVSAKYAEKDIKTGFHTTTPDPDLLFQIMDEMVKANVEYMVLEVTSHSLVQKRVSGITFEAAGITNITPEHLNLHETYENYVRDKAKIFLQSRSIFLNKDSIGFEEVKKYIPPNIIGNKKYFELGMDDKDIKSIPQEFRNNFPGDYNIQNALLAVRILESFGIHAKDSFGNLANIEPVKGRFQRVPNKLGINIVIDFAHTPNSMQNVLAEVKKIKDKKAKIITVFGCAAERDEFKRPEMGKISSELSDIVVITSEDPRNEDPDKIAYEIKSGNPTYPFIIEIDRKSAIKKAIELAKEDDWILILGKGHEESMNIKGVEYPWSDENAVKEVLLKT